MEKNELSDEFLMDAIAGRAMWALERLHDRYNKRCYALAYRMTADKMVAEELVQDTFFAVWQCATSYSPQASPVHSWLFSIIYHRTIDYLRTVQRSSALQQVSWQEVEAYERYFLSDVWEDVWSSVQNAELQTGLMQLPAEQREVIELAFFGGLTHCEIAQHCHMPIGTVKSRIRLGMSHLKQALEKEGVENTLSSHIKNEEAKPRQAETVIVQAMKNKCTTEYELCRDGSSKCFGYIEWEYLVEQIDTFEFRGPAGCFLARKEKRTHGCVYWYAYTWGKAGRRKTYLGRPAELTLARLEAMARKLYEV